MSFDDRPPPFSFARTASSSLAAISSRDAIALSRIEKPLQSSASFLRAFARAASGWAGTFRNAASPMRSQAARGRSAHGKGVHSRTNFFQVSNEAAVGSASGSFATACSPAARIFS
ncbi:MAG TPA: hypothetical protein VEJ18_21895 [Planctomycetota bacterium]|nr:hypothetical protein [Planctomycetota bacterium]